LLDHSIILLLIIDVLERIEWMNDWTFSVITRGLEKVRFTIDLAYYICWKLCSELAGTIIKHIETQYFENDNNNNK
jgi:hypothetical protein